MVTRLMKHDLCEMVLEWPMPNIVKGKRTEKNNYRIDNTYHDAPRYCADIVSTQIKNDEVILKGEIPARCIQEYRNDLTYFTNGQGVCLTELKGYQPAIGKFICQPRRPNSRIDKVRHMFHKLA
mgnify:CR=1 FL=1